MPVVARQQIRPQDPARPRRAGLLSPSLEGGRPDVLAPVVTPSSLPTPFRPRVEFAWGADLTADPGTWVWHDVTGDLLDDEDHPGIAIRRGRSDEASRVQPTSILFHLEDPDGRYSPRNPLGANYPNVVLDTPVRALMNPGDYEQVRAVGFVDSITATWDPILKTSIVEVAASGLLRRFGETNNPLRSPLTRALSGKGRGQLSTSTPLPTPVAYWPWEDGADATTAVEINGGPGASISGGVNWAASTPCAGSAPVATRTASTRADMAVPPYTPGSAWTVAALVTAPASVSTQVPLVEFTTTASSWVYLTRLTADPAGTLTIWNIPSSLGATNSEVLTPSADFFGSPMLVIVDFHQKTVPGQQQMQVFIISSTGTLYSYSLIASFAENAYPAVTSVHIAGDAQLSGLAFGHVAIYNGSPGSISGGITTLDPVWALAVLGYDRDNPRVRFRRLCLEAGIPYAIPANISEWGNGILADGHPWLGAMGVQRVATLPSLLDECEDAGGLLFETRDVAGLSFLTQTVNAAYNSGAPGTQVFDMGARYNRSADMVLDFAAGQVFAPFAAVEDTQRNRTDITASQPGGSSIRVAVSDRRADSVTVNLHYADGLRDQASWRVGLGTVAQMRYPTIGIDLRRCPELLAAWRQVDIGSRITIKNPPVQHAPGDIDQVVEGYVEQLRTFEWTAVITGFPYDPWRVGVIEGSGEPNVPLRLQTDQQSLASGVDNATGTLSVATASGPLLTTKATYPADFPYQIVIDGEVMTVTDTTGAASPQTVTVTRAVNGVAIAHSAGAAYRLYKPPVIAL